MKISILDDYHDSVRTCNASPSSRDTTSPSGMITSKTPTRCRTPEGHRGPGADPRTNKNSRAAPRTPAQSQADQPAQRLPAHRYQCLHSTGRIVSSNQHAGSPSYATAELTWVSCWRRCARFPSKCPLSAQASADRDRQHIARQNTWHLRLWQDRSVVAGYGRAFGMNVSVWAREASLARARADGYAAAPSKETFFEAGDVISLHMRAGAGHARQSSLPPTSLA